MIDASGLHHGRSPRPGHFLPSSPLVWAAPLGWSPVPLGSKGGHTRVTMWWGLVNRGIIFPTPIVQRQVSTDMGCGNRGWDQYMGSIGPVNREWNGQHQQPIASGGGTYSVVPLWTTVGDNGIWGCSLSPSVLFSVPGKGFPN